jgi:hypothetical protein
LFTADSLSQIFGAFGGCRFDIVLHQAEAGETH